MTWPVVVSGLAVALVGPQVASAVGFPTVGSTLSVFVGLFFVVLGAADGTLPRTVLGNPADFRNFSRSS